LREFIRERWIWGAAGAMLVMLWVASSLFQQLGFSWKLLVALLALAGLGIIALTIALPLAWLVHRVMFGRPGR
jgi:hypothetical protein